MVKIGDLKKLGLSLELDLGDVVEEIEGQPMVVKFGWRKVDDSSRLLTGINVDVQSIQGLQISYLHVKDAYWNLWAYWRPSIDGLSLQAIDKVLYVDNTTEFGGDVIIETPEEAEALNKMKPYEFDEHVSVAIGHCANKTIIPDMTLKPVFTQAMADAGELPPVGSKALISWANDTVKEYYECEVVFFIDEVGVVISDGIHYTFDISNDSDNKATLKPIDTRTPKQKAVDSVLAEWPAADTVTLGVAYDIWNK